MSYNERPVNLSWEKIPTLKGFKQRRKRPLITIETIPGSKKFTSKKTWHSSWNCESMRFRERSSISVLRYRLLKLSQLDRLLRIIRGIDDKRPRIEQESLADSIRPLDQTDRLIVRSICRITSRNVCWKILFPHDWLKGFLRLWAMEKIHGIFVLD